MFIRVNRTPNSPRKSVQIVENKRVGNTTRQTILYYVGVAANEEMEEKLKQVAREIIEKFEVARKLHAELFPHLVPQGKRLGRKKIKRLDDILSEDSKESVQDICEEKVVIDGVNEIAGLVYEDIGYGQLLSRGNELLKDLVLAQLIYPQSKHKLWQLMVDKFDKDYDLNKVYRILDKVYPYINDIKQLTCTKLTKYSAKINVILLDITTSKTSDSITDDGEMIATTKTKQPIFLMLATNEYGIPLEYEIFNNHMPNIQEMIHIVDYWRTLFAIDTLCFIGDKTIFTDDIIEFFEHNGYNYMVKIDPQNLPQLKDELLNEKNYSANPINTDVGWVGEFVDKDHNCRVLSLYAATNNNVLPIGMSQLRAKARPQMLYNGMSCVLTNMSHADLKELLNNYQSLIEMLNVFVISKNKTRSTRHWNAKRVEAHLVLCYMAFTVLKFTQYRVAIKHKHYSINQLLDLMLSVQSTIHVNQKTGERYKLPGPVSSAARNVYKAFNLIRSRDATVYNN